MARRAEAVEAQRVAFFAAQLRELGVEEREARRVAELLYLATLGFLERRVRSSQRAASFGSFGRGVSDLVLTLLDRALPAGSRRPPKELEAP